jgi:hypothetical protein
MAELRRRSHLSPSDRRTGYQRELGAIKDGSKAKNPSQQPDPHGWLGTETLQTRFGTFQFKDGYPVGDAAQRLLDLQKLNRAVDVFTSQLMPVSEIALRDGLRTSSRFNSSTTGGGGAGVTCQRSALAHAIGSSPPGGNVRFLREAYLRHKN